ncbi:bifunctional AP-4-A phosphorylase/ADP sulfurylase [Arachnomyces sp. PD_36]|nr:bifunctional AP-4-A phosphorylase/ADP sulfurylase [Arachnomyces sp. PD_36]
MLLGLPESLSVLVARKFATAKESGALLFSQTQVTTIRAANIPFQLRYCPALAKKPIVKALDERPPPPKPDPFQDPSPDLLVAEIPQPSPTHLLVLNKFPVIPNHFILATKAFKPQTGFLEKDDLMVSFSCLKAWETEAAQKDGSKRLFAFFNSGEHSGASQPHRHLQFLPVEDMMQEADPQSWRPLIDELPSASVTGNADYESLPGLPISHFYMSLPPDPSPEKLHEIYLSLYEASAKVVGNFTGTRRNNVESETRFTGGPTSISYNLAMTTSTMMICPRRSECAMLSLNPETRTDTTDSGLVSINGTILAGTLMVKAEAEWNELRDSSIGLDNILKSVGFPTQAG